MTVSAPTSDLEAGLANLDPVGVDELTGLADLQTRKDRKYLVPAAALAPLVAALDPSGEVRSRVLSIDGRTQFEYRSTYFDTPDLDAYLGAARRRPTRFKVRTRHYLDSGLCMLEVKTRDRRGRTVKHRMGCDPADEHHLGPAGRTFVTTIDQTRTAADRLRPTLITTYRRATLLLDQPGLLDQPRLAVEPGGSHEPRDPIPDGGCRRHPARVTVDTDLRWRGPSGGFDLDRLAIVETKTTGRPCRFDHILWRAGYRPTTFSKYGTGLAALDPNLPANKWNRVLGHMTETR